MGSGGGTSSQTSQATIAPQLQPLFEQSGTNVQNLQDAAPLTSYLGDNTMPIAPTNWLTTYAEDLALTLPSTPAYETQAGNLATSAYNQAGLTAQGTDIANDPAILAQQQSFEDLALPLLQNQMSLAGLGRSSSAANAYALANRQALTPMYEASLAREQSAIQNRAAIMAQMVPQLAALGVQDTARTGQAITTLNLLGNQEQAEQQAWYQSSYQDFLRRQALAEEALFTPFGALVPSGAMGQVTTGSQNQGGMFK